MKVVYDGQCPVCRAYCQQLAAREPASIELIDARRPSALLDASTQRGWDIDQGMVVDLDGELFYAERAVQVLAAQSRAGGPFGALHRLLFKHPLMARCTYPLARGVRNWLLRRLGIAPIANLTQSAGPQDGL